MYLPLFAPVMSTTVSFDMILELITLRFVIVEATKYDWLGMISQNMDGQIR